MCRRSSSSSSSGSSSSGGSRKHERKYEREQRKQLKRLEKLKKREERQYQKSRKREQKIMERAGGHGASFPDPNAYGGGGAAAQYYGADATAPRNYSGGSQEKHLPQIPLDHTFPHMPSSPDAAFQQGPSTLVMPSYPEHLSFPSTRDDPPSYEFAARAPPSSGYRIPLTSEAPFPSAEQLGPPPCYDANGQPIYIGSAILERSVHPCKIGAHLQTHVALPFGGEEHAYEGRYDVLPFVPSQMEFVRTSHGQIPPGRRPVEGGYEEGGGKLYHAMAMINGVRVPGKTGIHLSGCNVPFGGREHVIRDDYEILCWR